MASGMVRKRGTASVGVTVAPGATGIELSRLAPLRTGGGGGGAKFKRRARVAGSGRCTGANNAPEKIATTART
jgi:hypothetical protein